MKNVYEFKDKIELNPMFSHALALMENSFSHLLVTGKAGTGKSTLLDYFRRTTRKKIAILAPTGVAAVNIKGETIHSFFGFRPDITLDKIKKKKSVWDERHEIYRALDTIVIDEISMVRADIMDCVDKFLRIYRNKEDEPYGGVQMVFIGDLYQLPPVMKTEERKLFRQLYASEYFFDSKVFKELIIEFIELEKVYRQKDPIFIELLNKIRNNTVEDKDLTVLNQRYADRVTRQEYYSIHLTTTNAMSAVINQQHLESLPGKVRVYTGEIKGKFESPAYPAEMYLQLKPDSQVMLLNNDTNGRWINGTLGRVVDFDNEVIWVELQDGSKQAVLPYTWEMFHFQLDHENGLITTETLGKYMQYPLKLAWAITIHKSQGKTFDNVIIDMGKGAFAHGQTYVALSRCRTLEGITLLQKIQKKHVFMDWRVVKFLTQFQYNLSALKCSHADKSAILQRAIDEHLPVEIEYLKASDEKSRRVIYPRVIGKMEFRGRSFEGLRALCSQRKEERTFRIDRILELKIMEHEDV